MLDGKVNVDTDGRYERVFVCDGFCEDILSTTITLSLPVGTTYLPAGTFTLPVGTTYLLVGTIYYKIPNIKPEPEKKSKKLLEQERLGLEEAIRLQEQVDEEERAQRARDEEIARQLLALDEERATSEPKTTKDIDWNIL
ncbi:hypothetical protein Tco_0904090 [Tanacetum coccineum]